MIAFVEVLGVDAVADVDESLRGELADVAGARLVDAEAHGAVVGVDDGADEHDVGQRLDRTADRDVDERLAAGGGAGSSWAAAIDGAGEHADGGQQQPRIA